MSEWSRRAALGMLAAAPIAAHARPASGFLDLAPRPPMVEQLGQLRGDDQRGAGARKCRSDGGEAAAARL